MKLTFWQKSNPLLKAITYLIILTFISSNLTITYATTLRVEGPSHSGLSAQLPYSLFAETLLEAYKKGSLSRLQQVAIPAVIRQLQELRKGFFTPEDIEQVKASILERSKDYPTLEDDIPTVTALFELAALQAGNFTPSIIAEAASRPPEATNVTIPPNLTRLKEIFPPKTGHILVVDDEATIKTFIIDTFKMAGYEVLEASSPEEALDILGKNPNIVLVISDNNMPNSILGLEMLEKARRMKRPASLVTVLMSGLMDEQLDAGAKRAGVDIRFKKPFHLEELCANLYTVFATRQLSDQIPPLGSPSGGMGIGVMPGLIVQDFKDGTLVENAAVRWAQMESDIKQNLYTARELISAVMEKVESEHSLEEEVADFVFYANTSSYPLLPKPPKNNYYGEKTLEEFRKETLAEGTERERMVIVVPPEVIFDENIIG